MSGCGVEEGLAAFQEGGEMSRLQDIQLPGGRKWSPMKQEARLGVGMGAKERESV